LISEYSSHLVTSFANYEEQMWTDIFRLRQTLSTIVDMED
jgi:hypothetical protein